MADTPSSAQIFSAPKQRRSRESLDRVLVAATEILEKGGYEAFSVQSVSQRAGVGVGVIYARLGSKEGLFKAVHAGMLERLTSDAADLLSETRDWPQQSGEMIASAVAAMAEVFRRNEQLLRVFIVRAEIDRWILKSGAASSDETAQLFKNLLLSREDSFGHSDPELAADVVFRMVYDTLARRIVRGPTFESKLEIEWDSLVRELGIASATYLIHGSTSS